MDKSKPIIVAVDDQAPILHTLIAELNGLYNVRAFVAGKAGLKFLEKWTADLILLDYDMPEMNGMEVLSILQADTRTAGIPVIFLTGSEDKNIETKVLEQGAADFIQKPINARVLLTRVKLQLELIRYQNHLKAIVEAKTEDLRQANEQLKIREQITLSLLAEATDMRDHDTGSHIMRTTEMVRAMVAYLLQNPADGYRLTATDAENIVNSAKLHDMGKIAIPDRILLKPDKLDDDELFVLRQHPLYGAALLDKYISQTEGDSFLQTAKDIALSHHEKWDGSGYPSGLRGVEIPLAGRITAIADVYDALTSTRPYKDPFSHQKTAGIITAESGTHFDPYLVSVFLRLEQTFKDIVKKSLEQ